MNIAIKLSWLERARVLLGDLPPLCLAGFFEGQPHHPGIETWAPIGPYELGAMPDTISGMNRGRLIRRPLQEHPLQLHHAEAERSLDSSAQICFVDVFWNPHQITLDIIRSPQSQSGTKPHEGSWDASLRLCVFVAKSADQSLRIFMPPLT